MNASLMGGWWRSWWVTQLKLTLLIMVWTLLVSMVLVGVTARDDLFVGLRLMAIL